MCNVQCDLCGDYDECTLPGRIEFGKINEIIKRIQQLNLRKINEINNYSTNRNIDINNLFILQIK